jgi:hypothetical protein
MQRIELKRFKIQKKLYDIKKCAQKRTIFKTNDLFNKNKLKTYRFVFKAFSKSLP